MALEYENLKDEMNGTGADKMKMDLMQPGILQTKKKQAEAIMKMHLDPINGQLEKI